MIISNINLSRNGFSKLLFNNKWLEKKMGNCVNRETGFELEDEYEENDIEGINGRIVSI